MYSYEVGVGWLCRYSGIVLEPIWKRAHTQLVREHLTTVVSACSATVDWSWPKEWNYCARVNLHFGEVKKKRKEKNAGWEWMVQTFPKILTREEKALTAGMQKASRSRDRVNSRHSLNKRSISICCTEEIQLQNNLRNQRLRDIVG